MLKKVIKCLLVAVIAVFVVYHSVYFKKLSDVRASAKKDFNAAAYARNYMDTKLRPLITSSPEADKLLNQLHTNPVSAFKADAHALDIGNVRFFMVHGEGVITAIDENDVEVLTPGKQSLKIAMAYIFGNALRDAPGQISVNDFTNTMDLNNVSAELNKIVRNDVLPPFKSKAKKGDNISFAGAFELNQEHLNLNNIEIVPVSLLIKN